MSTITLQGNTLNVKTGMFRQVSFALDALRFACVFFPETFIPNAISSAQTPQPIHLDFLPETIAPRVFSRFSDLLTDEKPAVLNNLKLCLVDYENTSIVLSFNDLKQEFARFSEQFLFYREERLNRLSAWIETDPEVFMTVSSGQQAVFNKDGLRNGGKKLIVWHKVKEIHIETQAFGKSTLYLLPKGFDDEMLNLKGYLYALRISTAQKERVHAECNFWRNLTLQGGNF